MSDPIEAASTSKGSENPASPSKPSRTPDKKALRRKTIRFVSVFVVSVFVFLYGYERARFTETNDRYLLYVAQSTTFLLKYVGYSCELGSAERYRGMETGIRAALDAIGRGETPPKVPQADPAQIASSTATPLTPWESLEYQAATHRQDMEQAKVELDKAKADTATPEPQRTQQVLAAEARLMQLKQRDMGPLVSFILKPGLARRIDAAINQLTLLQKDASLAEDVRKKQVDAKQAEIAALQEELKKQNENTKTKPVMRRDVSFNFVVIPDCGAVQSMAIFVAAILAFPASWWRRLLGIIIGVPVLYWVNAFRLAFLAVIGALDNGGQWFKFAHEYVWQGIYIVFVVALWMGWVEFIVRRRSSV